MNLRGSRGSGKISANKVGGDSEGRARKQSSANYVELDASSLIVRLTSYNNNIIQDERRRKQDRACRASFSYAYRMDNSMVLKVYVTAGVSVLFFVLALVGSHYCESLLMLATTYHMLYNIVSICGDIICTKVCSSESAKNTYGWTRIKLLSLLISTILLGSFSFSILVEATQEAINGAHHLEVNHPVVIVVFGAFGLLVNILALLLIGGYTCYQQSFFAIENDLLIVKTDVIVKENVRPTADTGQTKVNHVNCEGQTTTNNNNNNNNKTDRNSVDGSSGSSSSCKIFGFFRDVCGFVLVLVCGCVRYSFSSKYFGYIDPALCFFYIIILLISSYTIMKESGLIMMQSIPAHIDVASLTSDITKQFSSILSVHDVHIWQLSRSHVVATLHAIFKSASSYKETRTKLEDYLENYGISSVTIQPEFIEQCNTENGKHVDCLLRCNDADLCKSKTCCGLQDVQELGGDGGGGGLRRRDVPAAVGDVNAETVRTVNSSGIEHSARQLNTSGTVHCVQHTVCSSDIANQQDASYV